MTYDDLLRVAHRLQGRTLETVTGKRFTVEVDGGCPYFTPESTGVRRSDGRAAAQRVVERFNRTGSARPIDYQDITRNSSYYAVLLRNS